LHQHFCGELPDGNNVFSDIAAKEGIQRLKIPHFFRGTSYQPRRRSACMTIPSTSAMCVLSRRISWKTVESLQKIESNEEFFSQMERNSTSSQFQFHFLRHFQFFDVEFDILVPHKIVDWNVLSFQLALLCGNKSQIPFSAVESWSWNYHPSLTESVGELISRFRAVHVAPIAHVSHYLPLYKLSNQSINH
jgi:hypothetical protein